MSAAERRRIGLIRKPHGIKGGVKLSVEAEMLVTFPDIETFFVKIGTEWQELHLEALAGTVDDPILYFEEVVDRDDAERLRACELFANAADLPELKEGEYLASDLVGCDVLTEEGQHLGKVIEVSSPGNHEVLSIETEEGEQLIPFVDAWVPEVDLEQKRIVVRAGEMI